MKATLRILPSLLTLLVLGGATPASAFDPSPSGPNAREVGREEIQEARQSNLYDFVKVNRPQWLRTRATAGMAASPVAVYLDGQKVGGPEQLRLVSSEVTASLRYIDGQEATTRYGPGHANGAILVRTGPLRSELDHEWRPRDPSA